MNGAFWSLLISIQKSCRLRAEPSPTYNTNQYGAIVWDICFWPPSLLPVISNTLQTCSVIPYNAFWKITLTNAEYILAYYHHLLISGRVGCHWELHKESRGQRLHRDHIINLADVWPFLKCIQFKCVILNDLVSNKAFASHSLNSNAETSQWRFVFLLAKL